MKIIQHLEKKSSSSQLSVPKKNNATLIDCSYYCIQFFLNFLNFLKNFLETLFLLATYLWDMREVCIGLVSRKMKKKKKKFADFHFSGLFMNK
jgi:hypothetical protein